MTNLILIITDIINHIYLPIIGAINSEFDTSLIDISPGFGSITWFTISLDNLIYFIIATIIYYIIIVALFKLIMYPFRLITRLF